MKNIKIQDNSGDEKMFWETIGKPAYERGLLEGRQESGLFAIIPISILENKTLSANAKLLYGEIMSLSKKSGICYATNEYMAEMIGLSKRSIPQILKELSGCGLIIVDIERNQKGTYRNITVSFFNNGGHRQLTTGGIVNERGQNRNRQNRNRQNIIIPLKEKKEPFKMTETDFNTFWDLYPRHMGVSKKAAYVKFIKLPPEKLPVILEALKKQKTLEQWKNPQFIPHPLTWINQERWEDEVEQTNINTNERKL